LEAVRLWLVEESAAARAAQPAELGHHAARLAGSAARLPGSVHGAIVANELLDALPPHLVAMREDGLREVFVGEDGGRLRPFEGPPSTPRLAEYLSTVGVRLQPGWRAEVNLSAVDWVRAAARALERGFLLLIDYGHEATQLYSAARAGGTLASFRRHASDPGDGGYGWLSEPGLRDITAHVDITGIRLAANAEGLVTLGVVDQTYFLLGLGLDGHLLAGGPEPAALERRLAAKALMLPGGLGSTHKVIVFGKGIGSPNLRGLTGRLT
jgi:SAM-dependent MidA family methyltransferase